MNKTDDNNDNNDTTPLNDADSPLNFNFPPRIRGIYMPRADIIKPGSYSGQVTIHTPKTDPGPDSHPLMVSKAADQIITQSTNQAGYRATTQVISDSLPSHFIPFAQANYLRVLGYADFCIAWYNGDGRISFGKPRAAQPPNRGPLAPMYSQAYLYLFKLIKAKKKSPESIIQAYNLKYHHPLDELLLNPSLRTELLTALIDAAQ